MGRITDCDSKSFSPLSLHGSYHWQRWKGLSKNMFYVGPDTGSIGKVLAQTCSQLPLLTTLISTVNCYLTQLPEWKPFNCDQLIPKTTCNLAQPLPATLLTWQPRCHLSLFAFFSSDSKNLKTWALTFDTITKQNDALGETRDLWKICITPSDNWFTECVTKMTNFPLNLQIAPSGPGKQPEMYWKWLIPLPTVKLTNTTCS